MVYRHQHSHVWGDELVLTFGATHADRVNRLSQAEPTLPGFRRGVAFWLERGAAGWFQGVGELARTQEVPPSTAVDFDGERAPTGSCSSASRTRGPTQTVSSKGWTTERSAGFGDPSVRWTLRPRAPFPGWNIREDLMGFRVRTFSGPLWVYSSMMRTLHSV